MKDKPKINQTDFETKVMVCNIPKNKIKKKYPTVLTLSKSLPLPEPKTRNYYP